jgi:hypothetical protein
MIPPMVFAAIGIKMIVLPNAELVRKGFPIYSLMSATSNVLPEELHPKWLDDVLCKITPSEYDGNWLNLSALAGSQLGRKEIAI